MLVLWLIAASVILITIAVLVYLVPGSSISNKISDRSTWSMQTVPQPRLDSRYVDIFLKNQKSTFRIFYYVSSIPRTAVLSDDLSNIAPNLNAITNNYDICENTNGQCVHKGFLPLLKFDSSIFIELLQAPDASRPNLPKTQLCIQTTKNTATGNTIYLETFPIQPFPLQKWVMLTITREGHRFDVYYNDELQASIKTTNVPYLTATNATLASTNIRGVAKYPKSEAAFSSPQDISADFRSMTDTRGEPLDSLLPASLPSLCPSGDCFSGPRVKPANPLVDWKTDYM